jgi:type IV pilus assembly protein PilM
VADEKVPFWKKEISFGRKPKEEKNEAEPEAEVVDLVLVPDPEPDPEPVAEVVQLPTAVAPEPVPAPEAEEPVAYSWLTAALDSTTEELREWATDLSASDSPPEVVLPEPEPYVPPPPPGIHPPVPASELPPLDGAEPKRKRRALLERKPKAPKPPKPPKQKKERKPKQEKERKPKQEKAPKTPRASRAPRGSKRLVGLKVGGSQIAAAVVANNGSAELLQLARERLEPGIVVGGELRDPDALAEALKAFFAKNKLPKRDVRLGIANNRIGVRSLEMAGIDDPKQLANAIKFRAQEALPIPIEDAVLDYQILAEEVGAEGETTRRVLLVVAYRELVDRYVEACRKAGISLAGIDLEAFALLRALGAPVEEPDTARSAVVAVAIGHDRSTFAVSDGRVCEFTRVLDWGGFSLDVAVARALDVAPSEAEPFKRQLSLDGNEVPGGLTAEQAEAAREALRKQVQSFARELVSSLQFYQSQPGSLGIGTITVTGGTSHLRGLADELERLIGVGVGVGDPLARVRVGKKVADEDQIGSLAVAIGLGIED